MKKLILLFLFCSIIAGYANAQVNTQLSQRLDIVFDSVCTKFKIKGATAAVSVPNQGMWQRAHGVSHGTVPITTDMYMGIGSNTKTYFSVLMLLLQEQGKLDLDDTIGTWINHPNISGSITIRQMLNHTSGLYNYTNNSAMSNYIMNHYTRVWPPDSIYNLVDPPTGTPGGAWDYSNTNYFLAGVIIEDVTGKTPYKVLRDEILTPQGLNETYFYPYETPAGTIPHSWSDIFGGNLEDMIATHSYSHNAMFSLAYTAGAIMATARDNALFWDKLMSGQILNSASMAELQTYIPNIGNNADYGLGIFHFRNYNGRNMVSHGGTNFGFINDNVHDLTSGVTLTVLTNQDSVSNGILLNYVLLAMHKETLKYTDVGIVKSNTSEIKVYPNPASNKLNIDIRSIATAQVYNTTGQALRHISLNIGRNTIDITELPSGTYFLNIQGKGITHRQTIQVVH